MSLFIKHFFSDFFHTHSLKLKTNRNHKILVVKSWLTWWAGNYRLKSSSPWVFLLCCLNSQLWIRRGFRSQLYPGKATYPFSDLVFSLTKWRVSKSDFTGWTKVLQHCFAHLVQFLLVFWKFIHWLTNIDLSITLHGASHKTLAIKRWLR